MVLIAGGPGMGERDGRRLHHTPGDDIDAPRRALAEVVGETLVFDHLETAVEALDGALDRCMAGHRPLYLEVPRDLFDEPAPSHRRRPRPAADAAPDRVAAAVATRATACPRPGGRSSGRAWACCGAIAAAARSRSPSGSARRSSSR